MADETHISNRIEGKCRSRARRQPIPADRVIGELAGRQHGVVSRWQLLEMGLGVGVIESRLRRGGLHRLRQGVYAVGHRGLTVEARWMAAVLSCGKGAVLSHRSAGQLWGVLPRSSSLAEVTKPVKFRPRADIHIHQSSLPPDEVGRVLGIPVTSVSRTQFDLAAVLSMHRLERALNEAEVRRLTDPLSLPDLIARYPRRRGVASLRALLDAKGPGGVTCSPLEERFVLFLDAHGLRRPSLNAPVAVHGRFFRVDCLWRDRRLVVELDGRASHGTADAFESDRERDRILLAEGWQVVRITSRQLDTEAHAVAADLRDLLRVDAARPTLS